MKKPDKAPANFSNSGSSGTLSHQKSLGQSHQSNSAANFSAAPQLMISTANSTVQGHSFIPQKSPSNILATAVSGNNSNDTPKGGGAHGNMNVNSTLKNFNFSSVNSPANVAAAANQANKGANNSQSSSGLVTEQHKQLIKQQLLKNAHKPQTKAILEKIMQNRASSMQAKQTNTQSSAQQQQSAANIQPVALHIQSVGGLPVESPQSSSMHNTLSITGNQQQLQSKSTGASTLDRGDSQNNINCCSNSNNNEKLFNTTCSSNGSNSQQQHHAFGLTTTTNPFHQLASTTNQSSKSVFSKNISAQGSNIALQSQQITKVSGGGALKKKPVLHLNSTHQQSIPQSMSPIVLDMVVVAGGNGINNAFNQSSISAANTTQQISSQGLINQTVVSSTSHRSHNKSLSRSSSVQKLRDTMYRFTMYHPNDSQSTFYKHSESSSNQQMQVIGDSKPIKKAGGSTTGSVGQSSTQINHISQPINPSGAVTSQINIQPSENGLAPSKFVKKNQGAIGVKSKKNKQKNVLAEKVLQQNALLVQKSALVQNSPYFSSASTAPSMLSTTTTAENKNNLTKQGSKSSALPTITAAATIQAHHIQISQKSESHVTNDKQADLLVSDTKTGGVAVPETIKAPFHGMQPPIVKQATIAHSSAQPPKKLSVILGRQISLAAPENSSPNEEEDFYLNDKDLMEQEAEANALVNNKIAIKEESESSGSSSHRRSKSSDSANSTQDFFYSKKNQKASPSKKKYEEEDIVQGQLLPPTVAGPVNHLSSKLPPKQKSQSSIYMFTFSNNDEDAFKRSVQNTAHLNHHHQNAHQPSLGHQQAQIQQPSGAGAGGLSGYQYTPTSSAGATTVGQSFSQATNSIPQKKRSIFSENQSLVRQLHEETFGFSASKNREAYVAAHSGVSNNQHNLFQGNPKQQLEEENANVFGLPQSTVGEKSKFKGMANKQLRISSPRFRVLAAAAAASSGNFNNTSELSSNRQRSNGVMSRGTPGDTCVMSTQSALKDYCEGTIDKNSHPRASKASYSQLMLQTFAKYPNATGGSHEGGLRDGSDNEDETPLPSESQFKTLQYHQKHSTLELTHALNNHNNSQASFTSLPRIKNQSEAESLTPLNNIGNQKRAFSVNFTVNKFGGGTGSQFNHSPTPSGADIFKNGANNRPTSSLISKNSGLPQVFLERYKKSHNFPGSGSINHDHFSTQSKAAGMFEHNVSPFPHPLESLTLQKRHLSSAECIINRPAFSEGGHLPFSRGESQGGFGYATGNFHNQLASINSGLGSLANRISSMTNQNNNGNPFGNTMGLQHKMGFAQTLQNTNIDENESNYPSNQFMLNSMDLKQLQLKREGNSQPAFMNEELMSNKQSIYDSTPPSVMGTPFQKSMPPPKPPGKRIQTQEIRQRKPVISKKFFGKIFSQSPEATRTQSEAGAPPNYEPSIFSGTLKNTALPSNQRLQLPNSQQNHELQPINQLRYQVRPNNESIISNGQGSHSHKNLYNNPGSLENVPYQINIEPPHYDNNNLNNGPGSDFEREMIHSQHHHQLKASSKISSIPLTQSTQQY